MNARSPFGGPNRANLAPRLISRAEVLTQLLAAIAAVPAGQRLHIPALRDSLINQGDVIKGIETLIAAGELDARTLRPPSRAPSEPALARDRGKARNWGARPTGRELGRQLEEEGTRRGLLPAEVSRQAFGNVVQIFSMRNGTRPVHRATLQKAETWLAKAARPGGGEEPPKSEQAANNSPPPAPIETQGSAHASPPVPGTSAVPRTTEPEHSGDGEAKSAEEPGRCPPASPAVTGAELADALAAYAIRHGLAQTRIAKHLFGASSAISRLRKGTPRTATVERVRAFLAGPPPAELAARRAGGPRTAAVGNVTGAALADEVEAIIDRFGLSKAAVGLHLFNSRNGVNVLRKSNPRRATVDKVRAFLANPPVTALRSRAPLGDRRFAVNRRDPTKKPCRKAAPPPAARAPASPLMDLADRQRLNGQRHQAEIRRAQEREATALVDAGVDPASVKSTFQAAMMRDVQRRRQEELRQAEPVEQAKLALRRRDRVVFDATVHGGRNGHFMVQGIRDDETGKLKELTGREIIALARRVDPSFRPTTPERTKG